MTTANLSITIIGGRNFSKQTKTTEYTEKFCKVKLNNQTQETLPKCSHQRNVTWGDSLMFSITKVPLKEDIVFTVYAKWTFTNEFLGEIRIPLIIHHDVPRRYAREHWYSFGTGNARMAENPLDQSVGEVGVIIGLDDNTTDDETTAQKRQIKDVDDPFYDKLGSDEIYLEACRVAEGNKETIERMIRATEQSKETGIGTAHQLKSHGEVLEAVEDDLEIIRNQISNGNNKLRGIESCFCCCFTGCCGKDDALKKQAQKAAQRAAADEKARAKIKKDAVEERKEMERATQKNKKAGLTQNSRSDSGQKSSPSGVIGKHQVKEECLESKFEELKKGIDVGLDDVSRNVQDLKVIALQISEEIDYENEKLVNIQTTTDTQIPRMERIIQRTKKQT
eukprot:TRINITY_DN17386_c0_g1_i1.p1 TRINITY_DN17386_c0_g1~~TRINITY_DN17386_c0_g1_i1.p1  ORF type:complete len:393 (-),score=74.25 TRINITY_DN17386_c0_g1_i1:72-1250(-)